jgi:hypothetical protein
MPDDYHITQINDDGVARVKKDVADNIVAARDDVEHYGGDDE